MKKYLIIKTEKGYVTSGGNGIYKVDSLNKNNAVLFPYDINKEEYKYICNSLFQNGFKDIEFILIFK